MIPDRCIGQVLERGVSGSTALDALQGMLDSPESLRHLLAIHELSVFGLLRHGRGVCRIIRFQRMGWCYVADAQNADRTCAVGLQARTSSPHSPTPFARRVTSVFWLDPDAGTIDLVGIGPRWRERHERPPSSFERQRGSGRVRVRYRMALYFT